MKNKGEELGRIKVFRVFFWVDKEVDRVLRTSGMVGDQLGRVTEGLAAFYLYSVSMLYIITLLISSVHSSLQGFRFWNAKSQLFNIWIVLCLSISELPLFVFVFPSIHRWVFLSIQLFNVPSLVKYKRDDRTSMVLPLLCVWFDFLLTSASEYVLCCCFFFSSSFFLQWIIWTFESMFCLSNCQTCGTVVFTQADSGAMNQASWAGDNHFHWLCVSCGTWTHLVTTLLPFE